MYVLSEIEAVSSNHCWSGKAISITISECVSVALIIRHENRILSVSYYIVICGLSGCTVFSIFFHRRRDVRGKKGIQHRMCFDFMYKFVRNTTHSKNNSAPYYCTILFHVKQVNQFLYRHRQNLRVPVAWFSQISRHVAHEGGKGVSPTHRQPLAPMKYSWYSFLLEAEATPAT